jgi:hypothetical protein
MTNLELQERFFELTDALQMSKDTEYFTVGQKICIHQERSAMMQAEDDLQEAYNEYINLPDEAQAMVDEPERQPSYVVPEHLNYKIQNLINNPPQ